jgi:nicotinate dehydrogenase subunit B
MTSELPKTLIDNPVISTWITVTPTGIINLRVGKVELGQGILTALTLIAANELGVNPASVIAAATNTSTSPDEGLTAGSMSIPFSGASVRRVCAEVRQLFAQAAARLTGLQPKDLRAINGEFRDRAGTYIASYAELASTVDLNVTAGTTNLSVDLINENLVEDLLRVDLPDKIFGRARFIHDLVFDNMLHARIARPPRPGAHLISALIEEVKAMPGVRLVVAEGDFLAVIAEREGQAVNAANYLATHSSWTESSSLPNQSELASWIRAQPVETTLIRNDDRDLSVEEGTRTLRATYTRPFIAHGSIGPSCALAKLDAGQLYIWSNSQGVFRLRSAIAKTLDLTEESVVIQHVEGAGSYGHNGADDAAFEAALLASHIPGFPIRVQWSRADELCWEPLGPAMVSDLEGRLDEDGIVTDWSGELWSNGHAGRPGYSKSRSFLSDFHRSSVTDLPPTLDPPVIGGFGSARNAEPLYNFARISLTAHRLLTMPIRSSALRSLGAHHNIFAMESFMDELADLAQIDPLTFRLAHLTDERAKETLRTVASAAGWGRDIEDDAGRGIAFAQYKNRGAYCAVIADIEADEEVRVKRLTIAVDVGRIISADGVRNQIEGGAIQATSWALHEEVKFDRQAITSSDWESYPILRFGEIPQVDVHLISRPDLPSLGAGEATMGPVTAAIGNAIFSALGVRLRNLPFTPENILKAIAAS